MRLDPDSNFSIDDIESFLAKKASLSLGSKCEKKILVAAKRVQSLAQSKKAIYGVNTGFGRMAQSRVSIPNLQKLQLNLLRSHASGIGQPLAKSMVDRLILLRVINLAKGASGISLDLIFQHLRFLRDDLMPFIPLQGSVGASGDLAPLAHLGLSLIGEGEFLVQQKRIKADAVFASFKMKPIELKAKEGLALVNGTQFSSAIAIEAFLRLRRLLPWVECLTAMSLEAHRASLHPFRKDLNALKAHRHQRLIAERIFKWVAGSPHLKSHEDCEIVQDAYSFRCTPQILSPSYDLIDHAESLLTSEINSVTDNPVLLQSELVSGGHFHAQAVATASDLLCLAATNIGNLVERRIDQMVSPLTGRNSAFYADEPGLESGLMIVQTAATSLVAEMRTLSHPASIQTLSTNGNQEDHVSMAPFAARKALWLCDSLEKLLAAELVVALRGARLERSKTKTKFSSRLESVISGALKADDQFFKKGDFIFADIWQSAQLLIQSKQPVDLEKSQSRGAR